MTPNITGTRRVFADHECCTATGLASAARRNRGRREAMPLENIIRDVRGESQRVFQTLRHLRHDTCPGDTEGAQPRATLKMY